MLSNDDKSYRRPHSSTSVQVSIELSRNPDDLALAVPNQVANKLEQLVVDYGYAYRAPNDALIGRKGASRDADRAGGRARLGSAGLGSS